MASTQNPITANREINDQIIHHNSNFDDGPEKGTELSPSTKADHVLNLESLIDETLYSIKRAIGGYYYYDVFTIFIRPFTLFITANSAFQKYSSQAGADDLFEIFLTLGAYVLAILAFMYSFPFLVAKSEQASYMVKIHYPFLMSNQLGDAVCRNVMFNVLQNMREEAAILTLLLGTITELFLIFGNFFLFVANIISTSAGSSALAIATIAALNLSASLYSFYQYCVFCMKIMVYRSKNSPLIYFCCCLCFQCVPEDAQVQTDLVKIDTDFGDTSRFFATDFAMPFQSKEYSEKYTLKREKHTDDQFDVALDLNEVQKSIPVVDGKVPFDVRDRFGLLSISGDAYLHNLERKDAAQVKLMHWNKNKNLDQCFEWFSTRRNKRKPMVGVHCGLHSRTSFLCYVPFSTFLSVAVIVGYSYIWQLCTTFPCCMRCYMEYGTHWDGVFLDTISKDS